MKNRILTISLREIKNSNKRFISLLVMSLLGVTIFIGMKFASKTMLYSLDKYYDDKNVYDIEITSNFGLTDSDLNNIKKIKSIKKVSAIHYKDCYFINNKTSSVIRLLAISNDINKVIITNGRPPKNNKEVIVEEYLLQTTNLKIGDTLIIENSDNSLQNNKLKIVGTVNSPTFLIVGFPTLNRGITNLGTGIVNFYAYTTNDLYNMDYYNKIYINVKYAKKEITSKNDYKKIINDSLNDIKKISKKTEWYINTREKNIDYSTYIELGKSIENLSRIFPIIFFGIAIFISIMNMARMALENRNEIGVLKALGFSNISIMNKYIIFSSLATIIGGLLGSIFGTYLFPLFIWNIYQILYNIPTYKLYYNFSVNITAIIIAITCITGSTILTLKNVINENTTTLLRTYVPKNNKHLLFEKTKIWKKISYSNKITIKNIARYKKRTLMTIIGITGCTILLLTGYGIRDAIVNVPSKQYSEIINYDSLINYSDNYIYDENLLNDKHIKNITNGKLTQASVNNLSANIIVLDTPISSNKIFKLHSIYNKKKINLKDNDIIISTKLASINKIKKGDRIKVKLNNNKEYNFRITDIFENYVDHYIIMNKNTYEKKIEKYKINISYIKFSNKKYEKELSKKLIKNNNIISIQNVENTKRIINNMLESLDNVVLLLFAFSAVLSFVVLYNLSYINICERKREIATLKALGFYDFEVDNYIIRENFIITIAGIILGIIIGKPFISYIVSSIEMDIIKFLNYISIVSYIKTILYMLLFAVIVSIIIHFTLRKIEMINSLKSIE